VIKTTWLRLIVAMALAFGVDGVHATAPLTPVAPVDGPRLVVLGTAQDGGLPQAGCSCERCTAARNDRSLHRAVASLAIWAPASDRVDLIDATPDIGEQLARVEAFRRAIPRPAPLPVIDRHPVNAIFLTHAHIGHYLGLAQLGFEALNTSAIPVYGSERMMAFLDKNAPWDQLVHRENIVLHPLAPGASVALAPGVSIEPLTVPHRAEYTDTFGYVIRGPRTTVLYIPDTDGWQSWKPGLGSVLDQKHVDLAILDGTFGDGAELPDRKMTSIGHPLMTETIELLSSRVASGRLRVYFTHLNHSNPALGPDPQFRQRIEAKGFRILADGQELGL
jgi:pyrroloquinoline quinone biosynthesis protein B